MMQQKVLGWGGHRRWVAPEQPASLIEKNIFRMERKREEYATKGVLRCVMCGVPRPFEYFRALHAGEGCALQRATRDYYDEYAAFIACERMRNAILTGITVPVAPPPLVLPHTRPA
jgi:hypothetical protein